jgi:hypothetical protein
MIKLFKLAASKRRHRAAACAKRLRGCREDHVGDRGMADVPASPIPPGGSELWTMWTSMAGASSMRSSFGRYRSWFARHDRFSA